MYSLGPGILNILVVSSHSGDLLRNCKRLTVIVAVVGHLRASAVPLVVPYQLHFLVASLGVALS